MKILKLNENNKKEVLEEAINVLKDGGILIYPTETTYGMGVDALNPKAVAKLFSYKEKAEGKAISIAVSDINMAETYVELNENAKNIYKNFLPGPVTVISKGKNLVADGIQSELGTLGIRIPNYPFILDLLQEHGKPITATGANSSYQKRPYSVDDILNNVSQRQKDLIDLIIDAGELPHNEPSTVVDTTLNDISVLRQGNVVLKNYESFDSKSIEDTKRLAEEIMDKYKVDINEKSIIIALQGEMGAGKTHFTKGIAKFLGINETIASPTYVLENEYDFNYGGKDNRLIHIDTWRMLSNEEFDELEVQKIIDDKRVIVIEWAEKVYEFLNNNRQKADIIWVKFEITGDESRHIIYSDQFIQ